eukprot:1155626-Pelagomonas_calceolata.AAC.1
MPIVGGEWSTSGAMPPWTHPKLNKTKESAPVEQSLLALAAAAEVPAAAVAAAEVPAAAVAAAAAAAAQLPLACAAKQGQEVLSCRERGRTYSTASACAAANQTTSASAFC